MLGPITRNPFESYYSAMESLTLSNSYLPFFVVYTFAQHSTALSIILLAESKMELGSKNTVA